MRKMYFKKFVSMFMILCLILSSTSFTLAENASDLNGYTTIGGTSFEDCDTWGFASASGTSATAKVVQNSAPTVADDVYYLQASGSGSGTRTVVKTLSSPTTAATVLVSFDWKPETVAGSGNSSDVLLSDSNGNPLFRLIKVAGTNGAIKYGIGNSGATITSTSTVSGVSTTDGSWLSAKVLIDFVANSVSMSVYDKGSSTNGVSISNLTLGSNVGNVSKISINGNRAGGTVSFVSGIDNLYLYSKPSTVTGNISSIKTSYNNSYKFFTGTTLDSVIAKLPSRLTEQLDNGSEGTFGVNWSCVGYDPSKPGIYTFEGILDTSAAPSVTNTNNIKATVSIELVKQDIPVVTGYTPLYYTDFGDQAMVDPAYWGFSTASATLAYSTNISANTTSALEFTQISQTGARVATKTLPTAIGGKSILMNFDWYPGELNDKGANAYENSGQFKVIDGSNNDIFTINNTHYSELTYFAGAQTPVGTGFTNKNTWYSVSLLIDIQTNTATLKLTDKSTNETKEFTIDLTGITFDYTVKVIKLTGIRTSGNNITWTTYLDNFGIYNVPLEDNKIATVNSLPYVRVYVGQAADIPSIGLPTEVTVQLGSGSLVTVPVSEWVEDGKAWDAATSGVYKFKGTLAQKEGIDNSDNRTATCYVYNRLLPVNNARQAEWLDRGIIALKSDTGIFISWRLLADEYSNDVKFNIYKNNVKLNNTPLSVTNYSDSTGIAGDIYKVETLVNGTVTESNQVTAQDKDYLSFPVQKPEDGKNVLGQTFSYSLNDASTGDLDGDGQYEIVVKWYPSNAIDSSQQALTAPTLLDAYKLDGTLLWRMDLGLNLTSGAHYNQFLVFDFDGDGKSEVFLKTADGTTVYGTTNGLYDSTKIISQIGNPADNGKYVQILDNPDGSKTGGHIMGGPEYISMFNGATGAVIDTVDYEFPVGDPSSWGDTFYNRSDRFNAGVAYLNGNTPSALLGRGYYARTTFAAYNLAEGKIQKVWSFDSAVQGAQYGGLGNHNLATGDVDNDGYDELTNGSLTLDQDGSVLYAMDGEDGRLKGSHGDAVHMGAFDPDREGLNIVDVHEENSVASIEYHDGATGESRMYYFASKDTGRGVAANITSSPGFEYWGAANTEDVTKGSALYNVQGNIEKDINGNDITKWRSLGLSDNFALYWDGDLLDELLDLTDDSISSSLVISKYDETTGTTPVIKAFQGITTSNGTKANPLLQADILGDWREEVVLASADNSEIRIYSTTMPTQYRLYTLMHDPVYRNGISWQNSGYNQPPYLGFYLGEDEPTRSKVLAGGLTAPNVVYTNKPNTNIQDTTAPTAPANLNVTNKTTSTVSLSWSAATDNTGVKSYEIYINGSVSATVVTDSLSCTITGLTPGRTYTFTVKATDAAGNKSGVSNSLNVTTISDSDTVIVLPPKEDSNNPVLDTTTGVAKATVTEDEVKKAYDNAVTDSDGTKVVTLEIPEVDGATAYTLVLTPKAAELIGTEQKLELKSALSTVVVPENLLTSSNSVKEISVTLSEVKKDTLSDTAKSYVGDRPAINFKLTSDGSEIIIPADKSVKVSIPYTPTADEMRNYENLVVQKIDNSGNTKAVSNGKYDPKSGLVTFTTSTPGSYGISFVTKNFTDTKNYDWAEKQIEVLAAKGIINGTSDKTFNPEENITRADFTMLLVNTLGLSASVNSNFTDVSKTDYYYQALGVAKELGIISGTGNGKFSPNETITRQDMMVIIANALKKVNKLSSNGNISDLSQFSDVNNVSSYAAEQVASLVKEGLVKGDKGNINPVGSSTRAEVAVVLYRIYNK